MLFLFTCGFILGSIMLYGHALELLRDYRNMRNGFRLRHEALSYVIERYANGSWLEVKRHRYHARYVIAGPFLKLRTNKRSKRDLALSELARIIESNRSALEKN